MDTVSVGTGNQKTKMNDLGHTKSVTIETMNIQTKSAVRLSNGPFSNCTPYFALIPFPNNKKLC
jgi:hypothetical protein